MNKMCYHPWIGLDISPQGVFRPCCKYSNGVATTLSEYQSSVELANLKESFLKNEQPIACKDCWDAEEAGLTSKRLIDWKYVFDEQPPDLKSLKVLSFPFGNSCNLACRICNSSLSSTWISETKKLQKHFPYIKLYKHQRFYQDKKFIDQIKEISSDVIHVDFPGGEPFLSGISEHLDFLDFLLAQSPDKISLHYNTNTTIFPTKEFWERWSKFKKVDIQLSIDGTGAHFEYNRWPAKWSEANTNIQKYVEQRKLTNNLHLSVSHTISIFTVYYLPEFIRWCLQNKFNTPYLNLLAFPKRYNIKNLPIKLKDRISKKLSSFKIENVVSYMNSEQLSSEDFNQFLEFTQVLDQQREESFEKTFPEFYNIIKDAGCQI